MVCLVLTSLVSSSCQPTPQNAAKESSGQNSRFHDERVYLLLATEVIRLFPAFLNASEGERKTPSFWAIEATLQINFVRLCYGLEHEKLNEETRRILEQLRRDFTVIFDKHNTVIRFWGKPGQRFDLDAAEAILPRYYPVCDTMVRIIGADHCVVESIQ